VFDRDNELWRRCSDDPTCWTDQDNSWRYGWGALDHHRGPLSLTPANVTQERIIDAVRGWRHGNCSDAVLIRLIEAYEAQVSECGR
jgi:hypothetical protein